MQRSDWFALLVGLFFLGAGAVLSTFPAQTIQAIGFIVMAAASGGVIIWFAVEHGGKKLNEWGPWVLIIGVPLIGIAWLYVAHKGQSKEPINGNLFVSCEMTFLPATMPGDGRLGVVRLSPQSLASTGGKLLVNEQTGAPGSKIQWPESFLGGPPQGWRCEITNDTITPLLEVSIPFEIGFGAGQSITAGKPQPNRVHELVLTRLDAGPENRRVVYLYNDTPDGGVGAVLATGTAYQIGQSIRRSIRIEQPVADLKKFLLLMPVFAAPVEEKKSEAPQGGKGGKGGSGEIFGNNGIIVGGKGGRVGVGGMGRGGDGGSGVIHGDGGLIIGGEGGSVDGTDIWYPPAQSAYIQVLESEGKTPDFNVQYPGAGGASGGWLQRQQIVAKIREEYFKKTGREAKIRSSKIEDVPLEYINEKLKEAGHPWRARIDKKYWYLYYIPHAE